jgi:ABC-type glycerol-3-phosphate transport system substrate-binding protein
MKMKLLFIVAVLLAGCSTTNYEYQVHLEEGDGTMHLYTGEDRADAMKYIKFYEKSHGDLKLVKFKK